MVEQNYSISTVKNTVPPKVKMSQYDTGSRTITFSVVDGSGASVDLTGKSVTVEGTRIDGHAFVVACTVSGSEVSFVETVDITNEAGDHAAELVIRENGERLGTMNFIVSVESAAMDEDASITPEDESLFNQLFGSVDDAIEEVDTAKDAALQEIAQGLASGSPLVANTVAAMTDTDEVYLYTGSESGYTAGSWYYYNGSAWVVGGVYGAGATDATLSLAGAAADAKATGDTVEEVKGNLTEYGAVSSVSMYGKFYPGSLTVEYKGNKAKVSGTVSGGGFTHSTFYNNASAFPNGISAGQTIQLTQVCDNSNVRFRFAEYIDGTATMICDIAGTGTEQIKISENATGCFIRLSFANGVTYDSQVTEFYIFTALTKQQVENAINEIDINANNIALLKSLMPMDYVPIDVTRTTGLVNRYNSVATPTGYSYVKQAVTEGDKYKVGGAYYGGNFPAYLILNNNSVLSFHNEATTGAFHGLKVTIPANATHLVVNGNTESPASLSLYQMVKANAGGAKSYDSILVGTTENYAYTNINNAIVDNPDAIISVDYGTYETEIQNLATDKIIVGKDRNLCVLFGTNRDYDAPIVEIACGYLANLTMQIEGAEGAEHPCYALHSDNAATANGKLTIENCDITCNANHTIGIGIRSGEEITFRNCNIFYDGTGESQAVYIHNSTGTNPAIVRFINCYFSGYAEVLKLQGWGSGINVSFEFINCTVVSTLYGHSADSVWTDYVSGSTHDDNRKHEFSGRFSLLSTSHGNNVAFLNAT